MSLKINNWQPLFWQAINERLVTPFEWGMQDCVLFPVHVLTVITKIDWNKQLVEAGYVWNSAREAAQLLSSTDMKSMIENLLGPAGPSAWCSQGDLVLTKIEDRESLCIHDGVNLMGAGIDRLERMPFKFAVCGWRI